MGEGQEARQYSDQYSQAGIPAFFGMQGSGRATAVTSEAQLSHSWGIDALQWREVIHRDCQIHLLSDVIYRSAIRITLENVSALPIDRLRLSFDDSTIGPAQQALADGNLSVFDTYETEFDLIHRPVFSWTIPSQFKTVDPGQAVTVTLQCFGKAGW